MADTSKTILYITYDGLTDPLGQSQILPYVVHLSKLGFQFTIVSFEKKERFKKERDKIGAVIKQAGIEWMPLFFTRNPPLLAKLYDLLRMKSKVFGLVRKNQFDLIHCRSYIAAQIGLRAKKRFGVKILFDMRGFWADEKKDSGHWSSSLLYSWLYNYYKKKEKHFIMFSDAIVTLTYSAKREILTWNILSDINTKLYVIPCCADLTHFDWHRINSREKTHLKEKLQLDGRFPIICYLGSIGPTYGVKEMILFFSELKKRFSTAKFLFFTKDDDKSINAEIVKYPQISENDIACFFVSREELPLFLSIVDYSIFFYKPSYSRIACSPTKFAELTGMGIPVICNAIGDLNEKFLNGTPTILVDRLSPELIKKVANDFDASGKASKELARDFALSHFSLERGVSMYETIYRNVFK